MIDIKHENRRRCTSIDTVSSVAISPYVLSDSALYLHVGLDLICYINKNEANCYSLVPSIIISLVSLPLPVSFYCTFTSIAIRAINKATNHEEDTKYFVVIGKIRRVTGIPAALVKTSLGAISFFLVSSKFVGVTTAIALSPILGIAGLPAQLSLLWSDFSTKSNYFNENSMRPLKYTYIHTTTIIYAVGNASLYAWSILNAPKRMGIIDHTIGDGDSTIEQTLKALFLGISLLPLVSVWISYAHLNENLFGLVRNESERWHHFKMTVKKITGIPAALLKSFNSSVAIYDFLKKIEPLAIISSVVSGLSAFGTQFLILFKNPIEETSIATVSNPPSSYTNIISVTGTASFSQEKEVETSDNEYASSLVERENVSDGLQRNLIKNNDEQNTQEIEKEASTYQHSRCTIC